MRPGVRFQWRLVGFQFAISIPLAVAYRATDSMAFLVALVVVNIAFPFHQWQRARWGTQPRRRGASDGRSDA